MYSIYCRTRAKQVTIRRSCSVYDHMAIPYADRVAISTGAIFLVKVAYVSDLILLKLRKLS